jgi:hypothetical protein
MVTQSRPPQRRTDGTGGAGVGSAIDRGSGGGQRQPEPGFPQLGDITAVGASSTSARATAASPTRIF